MTKREVEKLIAARDYDAVFNELASMARAVVNASPSESPPAWDALLAVRDLAHEHLTLIAQSDAQQTALEKIKRDAGTALKGIDIDDDGDDA